MKNLTKVLLGSVLTLITLFGGVSQSEERMCSFPTTYEVNPTQIDIQRTCDIRYNPGDPSTVRITIPENGQYIVVKIPNHGRNYIIGDKLPTQVSFNGGSFVPGTWRVYPISDFGDIIIVETNTPQYRFHFQ